MISDFFLGFAAHAHTNNELETDREKEMQLRRRNTPEEAQKLTHMVLDKLDRDISNDGYHLKDVKLLVLYLSYRGESEQNDTLIRESVLKAIENRFRANVAANGLRLIGHTTGGELENEDLLLKQISGIGYNGLSLLALITSFPIGVGRTWSFRTPEDARQQGQEMTRDAWIDFSQQAHTKEQGQKSKTLLVLAQGPKTIAAGHEHFLGEGIANFVSATREARIAQIIGGCSGDGLLGLTFHQFYGKLGEHSQLKVLEDEAVCALIPNLSEASIGLDVDATKRIGREHMFHFDRQKEPHFKYVRRISNKDPCSLYAKTICENEALLSGKGSPNVEEEVIIEAILKQAGLPLNPIVGKYFFAFPFGNYTCVAPSRIVEGDLELLRPVRSYTPNMAGYIVMGDHERIQKGARNVYNMLRTDQAFNRRDVTFLVTCITRRVVELMAGCKSKTEAEILKDGLLSTQVIGFLAYGELSFTQLIQEPYVYNLSCWGITLRANTPSRGEEETVSKEEEDLGIKGWLKGKR